MQLDMGSDVRTSEGKDAGKVKRIVFDADKMMVRQFVLDGGIFGEERLIGIDQVDRIDADHTVHLNLTEKQLDDQSPYIHADVRSLMSGDMFYTQQVHDAVVQEGTVPWDALVLSHGTEVYDKIAKHIGHLDEIVYEGDGHASCFIVDSGFIFTHDVKVPISAVDSITHERISLKITADEAEAASRGN